MLCSSFRAGSAIRRVIQKSEVNAGSLKSDDERFDAPPVNFVSIHLEVHLLGSGRWQFSKEAIRMIPRKRHFSGILIALLPLFFLVPMVCAQETNDLDAYKLRVAGMWWFSHPTGSFRAASDDVSFDLNKDFGFGNYSTFTGSVDWHFKRKHHFTLSASPVNSSKSASITRDITFRGVTYATGARVSADLDTLSITPGYQYDIIRRNHGYLGIVADLNMLKTTGKLTGTGTINNLTETRTASGSVFAPMPIVGAKGRWYPLHDSNRLSLESSFSGMYFFGYGNFVYSQDTVQLKLYKDLNLKAGYQLGTRFSIQGKNDNVGLRLTQQGPVAGLEASW